MKRLHFPAFLPAFLLCLFFFQPLYGQQEAIIIDTVMVITEEHKGFSYFQPYLIEESGTDWTSPNNFYEGYYHVRYEILEYKTSGRMRLQTCIWADIVTNENGGWDSWTEMCSPHTVIPGMGIYKEVSYPSTNWWLKDNVPVDWARVDDFLRMGVVVRCGDERIISPWVRDEISCWDERDEYLPIKVGLKVVMVAEDHTFSGWDNY